MSGKTVADKTITVADFRKNLVDASNMVKTVSAPGSQGGLVKITNGKPTQTEIDIAKPEERSGYELLSYSQTNGLWMLPCLREDGYFSILMLQENPASASKNGTDTSVSFDSINSRHAVGKGGSLFYALPQSSGDFYNVFVLTPSLVTDSTHSHTKK